MKRYGVGAAVAVLAAWSSASAQTLQDFFDDSVLHEIRILINPADWGRLKQNFRDNTYYNCDFQWRGVTIQNIGIRSSGLGSRSPVKPGLRVDFNRFEEDQEFFTVKSIKLDNMAQDPTGLRERMAMLLFRRMGLPASRETHARLFVNDQYIGLYNVVEAIDKEYLKRYLGDNDGYLYEYKYAFGWAFEYLGSDLSKYSPLPFQPETHEKKPDPAPLEAMVRTVNQASDGEYPQAAGQYFDLRLFLTHMAVESYLAEVDGILGDVGMANFYFYRFTRRNLSQFLPWDKDNTFVQTRRSIFNNAQVNILMRRTLAAPGMREFYLSQILRAAALAGGSGGWLEQEMDRAWAQIRAGLLDDPNKQCPNEDGRPGTGIRSCFPGENDEGLGRMRAFIQQRYDFVENEVFAAGYTPSIQLSEGGAVNAASNAPGITPGSLASIYGSGLGGGTEQATSVPLPTRLGGVSFLVNGYLAPLLFTSPGQVNLQVPWEVSPGSALVTAVVDGTPSNSIFASVLPALPGVFVVVHADGALVNSARPASAGDVLLVYATGLGEVTNAQVTGAPAPSSPLASVTGSAVVRIGGQRAELFFAGLSPGFIGLYQLNIRVPAGVSAGSSTPLTISIDQQTSTPVSIATR